MVLTFAWKLLAWAVELSLTLVACVLGISISGPAWRQLNLNTPKRFPRLVTYPKGRVPVISVVIPCYNEAETLQKALRWLDETAIDAEAVEIIVVNASSTDKTAAVAEAAKTRSRKTVLTSVTGRGQAHNAGAAAATGDIVFFLHSDTKPPLGWDKLIRDCLKDPTVVMGAFSFGVDRTSFSKANFWGGAPTGMGTVEWFANLRAHRFQLPYGDQGLFMLRGRWELVGPMPELLVMEDFEFLKRVRTTAIAEGKRIAVLEQVALCSGRRWEKHGVPYNTFANQWFVFAYSTLGYTDRDIYHLYYGKEPTGTTRLAPLKSAATSSAPASASSPRSPVGPSRIPQDLTTGSLLSVSNSATYTASPSGRDTGAAPSAVRSRAVAPSGLPASLATSQTRSSRPAPQRHPAAGRAAGKHEDSWPEVGAEDLLTGMPDMK